MAAAVRAGQLRAESLMVDTVLIERQSGLSLHEIEQAARMYARAEKVIICWAMGITQHHHSVATIQEIVNLQLLRGNLGRPGAGLCPVRGHSNVQGDRTMGINDRPPVTLLDAIEKRFQFKVPRENGHNTVEAINAMIAGQAKSQLEQYELSISLPSVIIGHKPSVQVGPGVFVGSKGGGSVPLDNPNAPNKLRCAVLEGVSYCY